MEKTSFGSSGSLDNMLKISWLVTTDLFLCILITGSSNMYSSVDYYTAELFECVLITR